MATTTSITRIFPKRKWMLLSGFFLMGATLFALKAFAAEPLGSERQSVLHNMISSYLQSAGPNLKQEGALSVDPKDGYFEATLPHLRAVNGKSVSVDLGTPKINARPSETDNGVWNATLALPQEFKGKQNGQVVSTLTFNEQNFEGDLIEGINAFSKIKASYSDVTLTDTLNNNTTTIGTFTVNQNGEIDENKRIVGPVKLVADQLSLMATGATPLTLQKVVLNGTVEDIDALMRRFVVKKETGETAQDASTNKHIQLTIFGLDKATSQVQFSGGIPSADERKVLGTLAVLQIAGKKKGNEDIRTYDLEITPQGKFLVNGTDLSSLL